jgi:hypothetical protein
MVSIRHVTLPNAHDRTTVTVIVQIEQLNCGAACRRSSHNAQPGCVPGKVLSPPLLARIEEWDNRVGVWITSFKAISTPFIAIAACQSQIIGLIRASRRLGQHMVDGEAYELPAFVSVAILAAAIRALAHGTPCSRRNGHAGLKSVGRYEPGD